MLNLPEINWSTPEQVDEVMRLADATHSGWAHLTLDQRKDYVFRFRTLLESDQDNFARMISTETGKPLWEAKTEVRAMMAKVDISIQAQLERCAQVEQQQNGVIRRTQFRPHGVMVVLGPFNLPAHLPNGHIIPGLLAGNTVVFKPSELTPGVGQRYVELWHKAGLPVGVLNIIHGDGKIGRQAVEHDLTRGVLFTGSFQTGQAIHRSLAGQPHKILALEMGGNNPLIVWDFEPLDAVSYMTIQSAFITSGQRCTCARRLIVPERADTQKYLERFIEMTRNIHVAMPTDTPEPFMGPVICERMADRVIAAQDRLMQSGAQVLLLCKKLDGKALLSPGVIDVTNVDQEFRPDEEIFGPLLQVIRVPDFKAAIAEANRTEYGLAAGLLSGNISLWNNFYKHIHAGIVNWNRPTTGASSQAPFGGVGKSGNHRPSAYFAADYCAYPVASMASEQIQMPAETLPGIQL